MTGRWVMALVAGLLACASAPARADDGEPGTVTGLELWGGLGVLGQNTTGIGEPLLGYGYDHAAGPAAEVGTRLLFGDDEYFRHGLTVRGVHQADRGFGRDGYGLRFFLVDAGYTFRTNLPCMSRGARQLYAGATLGVSGARVDAGTGRGPMGADQNFRRVAARELDHASVGWVLDVHGDVHYRALLVGLSLDLRQHFGIGTVADRTFMAAATLRMGVAFDFVD